MRSCSHPCRTRGRIGSPNCGLCIRAAKVWSCLIPEVNLLAQQTEVFQDFAAYDFGGPGVNITGLDAPEQVQGIHVSRNYFRLFGARFQLGRGFSADEDRPNGGRVVVISHALWEQT